MPKKVCPIFNELESIFSCTACAGDGKLLNYKIDAAGGNLSDKKLISLGTKPITLHNFRSNNTSYVFAASDRPTIIYSSNEKLLYSNLNEDEVIIYPLGRPFLEKLFPRPNCLDTQI